MIDLTPLVLALLGVLGAIFVRYTVPYFKAKTTLEQQANIQTWVKLAVEAAEMIYREAGMGVQKFQYVVDFLKDKGFQLDTNEIKVLIESAVNEMKNGIF